MQRLEAYHWPGNVRELENVLMKAVALSSGDTLTSDLLPHELTKADLPPNGAVLSGGSVGQEKLTLEEMEKLHVKRVLDSVDWHRGKACEVLGISRPRLRRMIQQYELLPPAGVQHSNGEDEGELH